MHLFKVNCFNLKIKDAFQHCAGGLGMFLVVVIVFVVQAELEQYLRASRDSQTGVHETADGQLMVGFRAMLSVNLTRQQ